MSGLHPNACGNSALDSDVRGRAMAYCATRTGQRYGLARGLEMRAVATIFITTVLLTQLGCAGVLLGGGARDTSASSRGSNEALVASVQRDIRLALGESVTATAYQGRIILRGRLSSPSAIAQAERVALAVVGVTSVDNRLTTP